MYSAMIGFALGIILLQQQSMLMPAPVLVTLFLLTLALFFLCGRTKNPGMYSLIKLIGSAVIGWSWASAMAMWHMSDQLSPELEERDMSVVGVVTSLPAAVDFGQRFQFRIEQVLTPGIVAAQVPRHVLLGWYDVRTGNAAPVSPVHPGERWQLNVRLRRPHGLANPHGSDVEVWMLEQGLGATGSVRPERHGASAESLANRRLDAFVFSVKNCIESAREHLRDRIRNALPEGRYAAVIVALVIGDQNAIDQDDWQVFARTGVSHLVAISGLHISMVAGLVSNIILYLWSHSLFTRWQLPLRLPAQKAAALSGALTALVYVALAGFGVPAQRTLIMICVVTILMWTDRRTGVVHALLLALGAVLLVDPWAVLYPGFWLSFSAVGFIFYSSLGRHRAFEIDAAELKSVSRWCRLHPAWRAAAMTQYAITLGLVPLTLLFFSQVSLVSPLANALAIPVVSLLVTPLSLIGSIMPEAPGVALLGLTHFILQSLVRLLDWLSHFSWAVWQAARPDIWMFLCASVGACWMLAPRGWSCRWAGLLLWLPLVLNSPGTPAAGEFRVTALDVGQGMALFVETAGHRMLYDTGPAYGLTSDAGSRVIYPFLRSRGIDRLDGLMISHNDSDHSGGAVSLLRQLQFDWVTSSLKPDTLAVQVARQSSHHVQCLAGQSWNWDGVDFDVLHPSAAVYDSAKWKPNARSCTLKISNGKHAMLLAGDIEAIQEDELVNSVPDQLAADILVAPHHGSGTSSTEPFLKAVHPQLALFLLGYHNRYHHPKAQIWQRYADLGIKRLRTDQTGAITLHVGDQISVDAYRQSHARYWYTGQVSDYIGGDHFEDD